MTAGRRFTLAALCGAGGAIVVAISAIAVPRTALAAWLAAALFVSAIPAGALAFVLTSHLHQGHWSEKLGAAMERAAAALPVAALVLAPVLLFSGALYGWADDPDDRRGSWLREDFFLARGTIYLALWWLFAYLIPRAWEETRPGPASVGLIVYALTASLAGFDWVLSLQTTVYSSVFGLIFVAHQMLAGFAFAVLVSLRGRHAPPDEIRGIGNMLQGGVMLWIYLEFMQYLVVWSGDLPGHTAFYLDRAGGGWAIVIYVLALGGGALPFIALLWRRTRENAAALTVLAALFLATRALETCWWVLPIHEPGWTLALLSVAAFVGAGGLLLTAWLWPEQRRRAEESATARRQADG